MKNNIRQSLITAALMTAAITIGLAVSSCAELAGTNVSIGADGFTITPPAAPIVIPTK